MFWKSCFIPLKPKKLVYVFSFNAASSMAIQRLKLKPRLWQNSLRRIHCSQTPPLTAVLLLVSVAWMLTTYFLRSSSYLNTDKSLRTGVLVRRLLLRAARTETDKKPALLFYRLLRKR